MAYPAIMLKTVAKIGRGSMGISAIGMGKRISDGCAQRDFNAFYGIHYL